MAARRRREIAETPAAMFCRVPAHRWRRCQQHGLAATLSASQPFDSLLRRKIGVDQPIARRQALTVAKPISGRPARRGSPIVGTLSYSTEQYRDFCAIYLNIIRRLQDSSRDASLF